MNESGLMMRSLLREARRNEKMILRLLGEFVRCESPSHDKAAVDRSAGWSRPNGGGAARKCASCARQSAAIKCARKCGSERAAERADHGARPPRYGVPAGHAGENAVSREGGRAYGPGTFDMKAGLVLALAAMDALRAAADCVRASDWYFSGTRMRRSAATLRSALIEREARRSDAVLVLEPAAGADGRLKTARKGVGTGRNNRDGPRGSRRDRSGSGRERRARTGAADRAPEGNERSAPRHHRAGHGDRRRNGFECGSRSRARRSGYSLHASGRCAEARIESCAALRPILTGARVEVRGGINRPPLERTPAVARFFTTRNR